MLEYTDIDLVSGAKYNYKVYASNIIGKGDESAVLTGTAGQEPGKITPLKIVTESSTSLEFSWDSSLIDKGGLAITGYQISHDDGDHVFASSCADTLDPARCLIAASATSFTFAVPLGGIDNTGKTYRFRVAAENELGTGVYSDEIQLVATDAPATPTLTLLESSRTLTGV